MSIKCKSYVISCWNHDILKVYVRNWIPLAWMNSSHLWNDFSICEALFLNADVFYILDYALSCFPKSWNFLAVSFLKFYSGWPFMLCCWWFFLYSLSLSLKKICRKQMQVKTLASHVFNTLLLGTLARNAQGLCCWYINYTKGANCFGRFRYTSQQLY